MQAFCTIHSSNRYFSTPTLKTLSLKNLILSKRPASTFLLITFFAQAEKFDKMHKMLQNNNNNKKNNKKQTTL